MLFTLLWTKRLSYNFDRIHLGKRGYHGGTLLPSLLLSLKGELKLQIFHQMSLLESSHNHPFHRNPICPQGIAYNLTLGFWWVLSTQEGFCYVIFRLFSQNFYRIHLGKVGREGGEVGCRPEYFNCIRSSSSSSGGGSCSSGNVQILPFWSSSLSFPEILNLYTQSISQFLKYTYLSIYLYSVNLGLRPFDNPYTRNLFWIWIEPSLKDSPECP